MTEKLICAVFPFHQDTIVVASVLEKDPVRVKGLKALFADLAADVQSIVAGTTVSHGAVAYVALDPAGEAERRFILEGCAVALDVELSMSPRLILVENADTLVEAGLLDRSALPPLGDCLVKFG